MEFSWIEFNNLIQGNPILALAAESIKTLGMEWILTLYQKGKMRTVDEELILCLEYSLETFSQNYVLEYDDAIKIKLIEELRKRKTLRHRDWESILEIVTDLKFDDHIVDDWRDIMVRTISEKRLVVLRDYIEIGHCRNTHENEVYPRILTAKPSLPA